MKVSDDILNSVKNLGKLAEEAGNLRGKIPSLIESLVDQVPAKDKEKMLKFVKVSNELLDKSASVDFKDVQDLINDYKIKYEQGTSNE
jgi:hypothetical protein